jgi:hypothetical protein
MTSLNNLTKQVQYLTTGTSGTNFAIVSSNDTHTFNLPTASATNTGKLSSSDWSNFNTAYNDTIVSASVSGTTTKTLTLTQQDAGTITASWTDLNTDAVSSVFGRTGAVVATSGDYTTTQVTEGTNLYYTEARVNANTNVAANTAARHAAVTIGTANGLSLSTQALSLAAASTSTTGALTSTDWNTFNGKQAALNGTGFVKISGTTISYDNSTYLTTSAASSTYLPLAGGTLTGALGGTSATFSGKVLINNVTNVQGSLQVTTSDGGLLVNADNSNFAILFRNTSSSNKLWDFSSFNNDFTINEGGVATRMYFKAGGNIGIGTTSPSSKLSVIGDVTIATGTYAAFSLGVNSNSTFAFGSTNGRRAAIIAHETLDDSGLQFGWDSTDKTGIIAGSANVTGCGIDFYTFNGSAWGNRMRVTKDGNVGIGTSSPTTYSLAGKHMELFGGSEYAFIHNNTTTVKSFYAINESALTAALFTFSAHPLCFGTTNIERVRVTSGGFTKMSSTNNYVSSASFHEMRANTAGNWVTYITNIATTDPYGIAVDYTGSSPNTSVNEFYYARDTGGARFGVRSNGGIANYQANDVNLSDERTKKDIIPLESYWNKFKAIEIVKFKYKDQTHDDFNIGVIAQQVEKVAPEFVDVEGWDNKPKLDEDGNIITNNEEPLKSIYTADLHHATIKVLQECMIKIEELKAELDELKNK